MTNTGSARYRWQGGKLVALNFCDPTVPAVLAADSWLVTEGTTRGLDLHRARFFAAAAPAGLPFLDAFWQTSMAAIPHDGQWFPRVEMQEHAGDIVAVFRQRQAPALARSITLATHAGADPRTQPTVKGPDTGTLSQLRAEAQLRGADDAVILSSDGYVVEAAHNALAWWRGDILCVPPLELDRVDSVTARTVIALATALGTEVHYESATPENLDGREIWSLNALHGIRIVTHWIDGPQTAEEPGRLGIWRARLDRLRKPIVVSSAR